MNVPMFIARRIAFNRGRSFASFIIRLATAATALSVAAMLLTLAFVNGFQRSISDKVFSFWGHIRVEPYASGDNLFAEQDAVRPNETVRSVLLGMPGRAGVQAFAVKSALITARGNMESLLFKGIGPDYDSGRVRALSFNGRWLRFTDSSYSRDIILSRTLASSLAVNLNDTVTVYFISPDRGSSTFRKLLVSGIYSTGIGQNDQIFALGDLRLIRRVSGWPEDRIGGYEMFLQDYRKMDTVNSQLYEALPQGWASHTIQEEYSNIFDWLKVQDLNRDVVFIIMGVVAVINLVTCLLILVLERVRMVGVLKAVGGNDSEVRRIFLFYASIISLRGIVIGFAAGIGLCLLQQFTGFIKLNESAYFMSVAPVHIVWWQSGLVCLVTFLVCVAALIIPTALVRGLSPVKAIRMK